MIEAIGSSSYVGVGMWNPLLFKLSDVNSPICVWQYFLLVYWLPLHSLFDFIEVTIHAVICEIPTFCIHCLTFIFSAVDLNFPKIFIRMLFHSRQCYKWGKGSECGLCTLIRGPNVESTFGPLSMYKVHIRTPNQCTKSTFGPLINVKSPHSDPKSM